MRWMMSRWWHEGRVMGHGGLVESVFLHSPVKGFWGEACLGGLDLPPWLVFCAKAAPLSSGQIVPRVTIAQGNYIHPTWETLCQTLYCRLFKATTTSISACTCNDTALALFAPMRELHSQCLHGYGSCIRVPTEIWRWNSMTFPWLFMTIFFLISRLHNR